MTTNILPAAKLLLLSKDEIGRRTVYVVRFLQAIGRFQQSDETVCDDIDDGIGLRLGERGLGRMLSSRRSDGGKATRREIHAQSSGEERTK